MITVAQFERAQVLLGRVDAPRPKSRVFAYTGLIKCGFCGCSITAEHKINRFGSHYIYYHCTRKKRAAQCHEQCVEERSLEAQVLVFLKNVYADRQTVDEYLGAIEEERAKRYGLGGGVEQAIRKALESCARHLDNLTKMRYRELIHDEEFARQRAELTQEQRNLAQRLEQLHGEQWIEPSRNLFLFSNRAVFWLVHGSVSEKRQILSTVGSNPTLKSKELNISAKEPFLILQKYHSNSDLCWVVNEVRTFFEANPSTVIPLLPEPFPT